MVDDERGPYRAAERDGLWVVVDGAEEVVCACGDERNAGQYAAIFNQAWRRGYKSGYRAAKNA